MSLSPEAQKRIERAQRRIVSLSNPLLKELPEWVTEFRPHQVTAIEEIRDAFERGTRAVVLDAPTGSGKTLIAESVRRLLDRDALYLCNTKGLQRQFSNDYPYSRELLGRSNYPTVREVGGVTAADCTKVKGDPESCQWCPHANECPYEIAKRDALRASVAVLNMSYFLTECNGPGRFSGKEFVIADEADTLERELMSYVEVFVSSRQMQRYKWEPPKKVTKKESWLEWVGEVLPKVSRRSGRLDSDSEILHVIREKKYLDNLKAKLEDLESHLESGDWVYTGRSGEVSFKPARVSHLGERFLWQHGGRWLLMSATVVSPEEMLGSLGYTGSYEVVRVPSTFPVENRPVKVMPLANMGRKTKEEEWKLKGEEWPKLADGVSRILARHRGERVLLHTVSYELAEYLGRTVTTDRPWYSYTGASGRNAALDGFLSREGSVLAAPSFDRGIDLPHEKCRVVVVCKVPFPYLGDKQVSQRLYGGGQEGKTWYTVQTVRRLVQMSGRAVRAEDDWAVTYILDSQFAGRLWSQARSLFPKWWADAINWRVERLD